MPAPRASRAPRLVALAVALAALTAAPGAPWPSGLAHANGLPRLTWFGQSCFLLETAAGTRVLMDPAGGGRASLPPEGLAADLVTISHEHPDHNGMANVTGNPKVMRGLTPDKKGWMKLDETFKDVSLRTIGVYHDEEAGQTRGLNTIFVFETGGLRVAHLGDLGHTLSDRQLSELGQVDVVLVPVGGTSTIDADRAARVVDQIRPRLSVIPMHYQEGEARGEGTQGELAPVEVFIAGRPHVKKVQARTWTISTVKKRPGAEVVVLGASAPLPASGTTHTP